MICPVLDRKCRQLDAVKAAHHDEVMSPEEMRCMWDVQAHASHGHDDKPCPGDWAQMYNSPTVL